MSALRRLPISQSSRLLSTSHRVPSSPVCIFCEHGFPSRSPPQRINFSTSIIRPSNETLLSERARAKETVNETPTDIINSSPQADVSGSRIEEDYSLVDDAQARQNARLYAEQLRRDEKFLLQRQVNNAPIHQDYVPATTWDGLEMVGGEKEWDTGKKFQGFLPVEKLKTPEEITVAIYRAVVEIFGALGAGKTPRTSKFYTAGPLVNEASQVKIELTKADEAEGEGKLRLRYPSTTVEQTVLRAGSDRSLEVEAVASAPHTVESLDALIKSWGQSWLHIPLQDSKVKFTLIKRINKLTGLPISDIVIHNATSVASLVNGLLKNKGGQKLFEKISADGSFLGLKNVKVMGRRETPVDKEMEVGRWKVIEKELRRRDLPVLGRG